jgi:mono/diheme cytochrome c family protein
MTLRRRGAAAPARWALCTGAAMLIGVLASSAEFGGSVAAQTTSDGWQIGEDAIDLQNPVALSPSVVAKGADLYRSSCQRCHGRLGRGNGPDADPDQPPRDLTDGRRASRNPDGVLFYKIWNGRRNPRMPAFKSDMTRDEVWAVVHYIKTLRVP